MGLSASQARLLTITARLTDNEYHSQQIANAKTRLAAKGTAAREEYQDALNSKILTYNGFDTQGNATSTVLTPSVIYQYQPLKNQYALINTAGKVIVNHTDAQNFEETNDIMEFLDAYNLIDNPGAFKEYEALYRYYLEDLANWNEEAVQWTADNERYQEYLIEHAEWEKAQRSNGLYEEFSSKIGTSNNPIAYCYEEAIDGHASCYLHLLNMMLDYDGSPNLTQHTYQASCDQYGNKGTEGCNVTTNAEKGGMFVASNFEVMKFVTEQLNMKTNGEYDRLCDGDDDFYPEYLNGDVPDTEKFNALKTILDAGGTPTALDILKSDYIYDPETKTADKLKSLKQKAIDLYYMIQCGMIGGETLKETLINFTEGDMRGISTPEPEFVPDPGELRPKPKEPEPPKIKVNDLEKAQWYVNLWCRMNGEDESPRIQTVDGLNNLDEWFREYILNPRGLIKNTFDKKYEEIDMNLATSSTWLEDVLSQGIVVMQRVNSHKTDTQKKYCWDEIIYTDASELNLVTDDNAIARAEAEYEAKMHEIETKDKRYQLEINKLDSEHNALQTQVESIRSEVSKNIDRSFKAFS